MASRRLEIIVAGDATGGLRALDKINGAAGKTESKFSKFGKIGAAAFAGVATAAVAFAGVSVKAALEGEKAQARYETAVHNAGGSVDVYNKILDNLTGKYARLGFENDELQDALAKMTAATHSPEKALKNLGLAADIARGRNISLSSASDLLDKVLTGHVGLLGKLGIQTKDAAGKTISQEEAVRKLSEMYGGAAQRNAQTFAGKAEALKAQLHNTEELIGQKLLPILAKLADWTARLITWFSKHKAVAIALAAVIGGVLLAATIAWTVSLFAAGGALAFLISPITAVVVAIAAIITVIVLVWTHWDQIWNWISHHKAYAILIAAIFPITAVVLGVIAAAKYVADHWAGIWGGLTAVLGGVWQGIKAVFIDGVNFVIRIVNDLIQAWNDVPFHKDVGKIGYLGASSDVYAGVGGGGTHGHPGGGHVSGGGSPGPVHVNAAAAGAAAAKAGAGGGNIILNVAPGMGADGRKFGADFADHLVKDQKSGGPISQALAQLART